MQIEAAESGRVEDGPGQDEAVGDDDGRVTPKRGEGGLRVGIAQREGRANLNAMPGRTFGDRRGRGREPPTPGPSGLCVDGSDVAACGNQGCKRRHRKIRRAHEGEAQRQV